MFMGEFQHSIDSKGRVIIPSKFRNQLGSNCILTRGMDGCIFGYPEDVWRELEEKMKHLPLTKRDARAFSRFFYSGATECEFDKQGRVNIPSSLIKHAELDQNCILVGVSNRFEIWNLNNWHHYNDETEMNIEDIAESMEDFDL